MSQRGSTIKRGKTWTAYWFAIDPETGKRRQHSKGGFPRKTDAKAHLNSLLEKVDQGAWRPDKKLTVEKLLTEWLAAKRSEGLRANTTTMYETVIEGWLLPHVRGLSLDQLTPKRAGEIVEALRPSDPEAPKTAGGSRLGRGALSPRSVQLAISVLKAATRWAFETQLVSRDPLAGFRRPKTQASSAATSAWTPEEAGRFLSSVADDRLRALWWVLLCRGLRRGEAAGLRWANIELPEADADNQAGVIRIIETRVVVASKPTASTPKTAAGRRAVPLDARLVAELRSHKARQAAERLAAEVWEGTGYVFVDELGHPYRPETISRKFASLAAKAKLRPIRLHDTRHTAASLMMATGENAKVVAEILGHSSPVITQVVYQHVTPGMGAAAGGRLTDLLAGHVSS